MPNNLARLDELEDAMVVVDTSTLLLMGTNLLSALPKCTLVIPAVVVKELEEKRTNSTVGYLARQWINFLEDLRVKYGKILSTGVDCDGIVVIVEPNHMSQKSLPIHLQDGSNDSTILSVAKNISDDFKSLHDDKRVVLLSNDTPMRLHATLDLHMEAFEFSATEILRSKPFDGRVNSIVDENTYADMMSASSGDRINDLIRDGIVDDCSHAVVDVVFAENEKPHDVMLYENGVVSSIHNTKNKISGIIPKTLEQKIAMHYLLKDVDDVTVVSLGGGAGTGKTLLTMAAGLDGLKNKKYKKILVFRSLHEMGQGQELGFLPGDVNEKMAPWAGAIHDALDVIEEEGSASELFKKIEVSPITYLRGRSLSNSYIVLEEAQNFSRNEILNILSRAGKGSKIVLTFDSNQVDSKYLQSGAKADIWSVVDSFKSEDIFAHITLKKTERSKIAEIASALLEKD